MESTLDAISPELQNEALRLMGGLTPEEHTVRTVADFDDLLRQPIVGVMMWRDAEGVWAELIDDESIRIGPHQTAIGAMAACVEALRARH